MINFYKVKNKIAKRFSNFFFTYFNKELNGEEAQRFIVSKIINNESFFLTRLGSTELQAIYELVKKNKISKLSKDTLVNNAGFFPIDHENLQIFIKEYQEGLKVSDLIGYWNNIGEDSLINTYAKEAYITKLANLEPYYFLYEENWLTALEGKKILVIHPFKESIKSQNNKGLHHIWELEKELYLNLEVLEAPQTIGGRNTKFNSWYEALEETKRKSQLYDFELVIIGAGSYGLPLGSYFKKCGKQVIHLGGATQILFGIKGRRWDNQDFINQHYNKYWIRPLESEKPKNYRSVEKGCYW